LWPLRRLYGAAPADSFGPRALMAVRDATTQPRQIRNPASGDVMDEPGWCRNVANRHLSRLKHVFKWAVENELIAGEVYYRLSTVKGYRRNWADVRETEEVKPVPQAYIDAALPHVSRQVRAMIHLQLLTGMRPGEVCAIRTCDIETGGRIWIYRPLTHRTAHHGHKREIRIGPRARTIVEPFLKPDVQGSRRGIWRSESPFLVRRSGFRPFSNGRACDCLRLLRARGENGHLSAPAARRHGTSPVVAVTRRWRPISDAQRGRHLLVPSLSRPRTTAQ
jgi:integrase